MGDAIPPQKPSKRLVKSDAWTFIFLQALLLSVFALTYVSLHSVFHAEDTYPGVSELVQIDGFGLATVISAEDVDWFVGSLKSVPLLSQMNERNKEIQTRTGAIRQQLQDFSTQFSGDTVQPIRMQAEVGHLGGAGHLLADFRAGLAPGNESVADTRLLTQLEQTLQELQELKRAQFASRELMRPPRKFLLFWASPWSVVAEVMFWSLFGLFASLLYHSARFARKSRFRQAETYVGWTKLFYTPIVAAVVMLALAQGVLQMGNVVTRVWVIPLIGVLVGFSSRKTAKLVDALSEWSLGRMADSLKGNKQASVPSSVVDIQKALVPPSTFSELADHLKAVAAAMLGSKLDTNQKST